MDLGKFNPEDFETHETAFINLLAQTYGAQSKNLNSFGKASELCMVHSHFVK
jgi:hypothetical protein